MRIVKEIPHSKFKISVFSWNDKYILKIELDNFEQGFKFSQHDFTLQNVEDLCTDDFLLECLRTFVKMRDNLIKNIKQ